MSDEFRCWDIDNGMTEAEGTDVILVHDAEDAAREFAKDRYARNDYPDEQRVGVRDGGKVRVFVVRAEPDVRFRVAEERTP